MRDLVVIDGNNLCCRVHYAMSDLEHKSRGTGLLYGGFRSLISLTKKYPESFLIMAWDTSSTRRLTETRQAVSSGMIPSEYKANRQKESTPDYEDFCEQRSQFQEAINLTRVMQVQVPGYEADDVIYSYCLWAVDRGGKAVIVSSDKDMYQCLRDGVTVFDAMKGEEWTLPRFKTEFGCDPSKWLEVRAIAGEAGDNIHGVDGWGEKTAMRYVKLYGGIEGIDRALRSLKRGKREQTFIEQVPKAQLARSVARMDRIVNLPRPKLSHVPNPVQLKQWFFDMEFVTLLRDVERLS